MGIMENMVHAETARTVTSININSFEGRSGKLPLVNGFIGPPKYKRPKISAVRDFPPGCGTVVPTVCLKSEAEGTAGHTTEYLVSQDNNVNVAEANCVRSSGAVLNPHLVDASTVPSGNVSEKSVRRNYPPRRRASATRDFPPHCGRNPPCLSKEEAPKEAASLKNENSSQDKIGSVDNMLENDTKSNVKQIGEAAQNGIDDNIQQTGEAAQDGDDHNVRQTAKAAQDGNDYRDSTDTDISQRCNTIKDGDGHEENRVSFMKHQSLDQEKSTMKKPLEETLKSYAREATEGVQVGSKDVSSMSSGREVKNVVECDERDMIKNVKLDSGIDVAKGNTDDGCSDGNLGKQIVVYEEKVPLTRNHSDLSVYQEQLQGESKYLEGEPTRVIVQALMAAPNCPWRRQLGAQKTKPASGVGKGKGDRSMQRKKAKSASKASKSKTTDSKKMFLENSPTYKEKSPDQGMSKLLVSNKDESAEYDVESEDFHVTSMSNGTHVNLPPFGHNDSSDRGDGNDATVTRHKVRETLRLFQAVCRKLLQEEEAKLKEGGSSIRRVDLHAVKILKDKGKHLATGKGIIGAVPGVEVGDEFHYRVELNIIGLHRPLQGGIDYIKHGGGILCTSIVSSGGYADDLENSDSLIYTGSGGNVISGGKEPEDQKLERGNLALKNSVDAKNPVRVIRGFKDAKSCDQSESRSKGAFTYTYDGLYLVERYWQEPGPRGKLVFKFQLGRIPGQPELAWKEVKNSKTFKTREGLCVDDISQGKEKIPIFAVNTIDDEKPPPFTYVVGMIYPDWCRPIPPKGCDCKNKCLDSENCSCAVKNGGEIPYNHNGAIVEAKPLVYECGPNCKCPPSCYNRVSQHGVKFQLEIFKTESRGWGVRSLNSIPSGSFICEYAGELLEDTEAEQRTGNDEYLFDIGNNSNDSTLWDGLSTLMPDLHSNPSDVVVSGFTIDAAQYGNVGRFVNHSCSPNVYAQNVLYDHEDKRIPHIMLFAAENIPPLQELTYHYNYTIDQVYDSEGNIKQKKCYCGSSECTGRLY